MSFQNSMEDEKQRLESVLEQIGGQLEKIRKSADDLRRDTISMQRSMREHIDAAPRDLAGFADVWQFQSDLMRESSKVIFTASKVSVLEKMLSSPYFGRLDFKEDGESTEEKIYIGISNLAGSRTGEYLIYDWRAPVSSMFYDHETGRAGYDCPAGRIEGYMGLKRQFRIWQGKLEFMFDCSLAIEDDILQEILGRSADGRMKTIVTSIQREQNRAIRNDTSRLLTVHGPAGSGKTSIALHRAAYLLYRHRESIRAENIAIFSPNSIFNDYISDVLPELGEEDVRRTTFAGYAWDMPGRLYAESSVDAMEFILAKKGHPGYDARIKGMKFKSSRRFSDLLKEYALFIEESLGFRDICHGGTCIETGDEILDYFRNGLKFLPVTARLEKIRNRLTSKLDEMIRIRVEELVQELAKTGEYPDAAEIRGRSIYIAREEFSPVRETVESMTELDAFECYCRLYREPGLLERMSEGEPPEDHAAIAELTLKELERGIVLNEDVAPLLLLKALLSGINAPDEIKYVIVDEVQDYSTIQLEVLSRLFPDAFFTMLGDRRQRVNPYGGNSGAGDVAEVFGSKGMENIELSRSYRSTRQIAAFCREIAGNDDEYGYMEREGDEPQMICRETEEELYELVVENIKEFAARGYKSIAVICRTAGDCKRAFAALSGVEGVKLVSREDSEYVRGICVIPSYLSKGLEFDAVLALRLKPDDYTDADEKNLFYTVCSRALHKLDIYYVKKA